MPPKDTIPAVARREVAADPEGEAFVQSTRERQARRRKRRFSRSVVAVLGALGTTLAVISVREGSASAGIASDKAKISQLEQRVQSQGEQVQSYVIRYDELANNLQMIEGQIAIDRVRLKDDKQNETEAAQYLREMAVDAYVNASSGSSSALATLTSAKNASTVPEQQVYVSVANKSLNDAIATFDSDESLISATQSALESEQAQTTEALSEVASSRAAAQDALGSEDATLNGVSANLRSLVTAANDAHEQEEQQESEEALAVTSAQQATTGTAGSPPASPSPGSYANPIRGVGDLSPERVDQGVDYTGFGPIFAIGAGVVVNVYNGGWPGGTFIVYRLTDGPADGLAVYAAEDIEPSVQVGEAVTSSTVIGQVYEGPDGIETGWADPSGDGTTMAADFGEFDGYNSTSFGYNFSQLLQALGAPGGIPQNDPPTGDLPSGWPQW